MGDLLISLDKSSPVPLYHQLARELEQAILRGDLEQGDRLDNEHELAAQFGISRPTIRRAIEDLVDKGLLVRKRGVGTQVVRQHVLRPVQLSSLFDDLQSSGQQPTTQVIVHCVEEASRQVAKELHLAEGPEVVYLERIRFTNGRPLALMRNWLPLAVGAGLTTAQLEETGMYQLLRTKGIHPRVASQRISAKAADAEEARVLEVAEGAPLVTAERITYDDYGRAFEYGSHVYEASSYSFEVTLVDR